MEDKNKTNSSNSTVNKPNVVRYDGGLSSSEDEDNTSGRVTYYTNLEELD